MEHNIATAYSYTIYPHHITRRTAQHETDFLLRPGCNYGNVYEQLYKYIQEKKRTFIIYTDYVIMLVIFDDDFS